MSSLPQKLGILRSLLLYYAVPWRPRQMRALYGRFIQPGDLCFDIGAHVGNRLRVWSQLGAQSVGLEPQPHLMAFLQRWYGRSPHVTLLQQAVGAAPGQATLHVSSRTPTVTTLSTDWIENVRRDPGFASVTWDTTVSVQVTTLDTLIARFGEPAFCKIDVEGYELDVLWGLSRPLRALSFEVIPAALDLAYACFDRLAQLGRYVYNWSPGESHRLSTAVWWNTTEIKALLKQQQDGGRSGDVYARLMPAQQD